MLAVKKLTTMSYSELIVALENIIVDKVVTVPTARNKKHGTSAPMEIGMAAKEDGENETPSRRPEDHGHRSAGFPQRELAEESDALACVRTGMRRVAKVAKDGGRNPWQKGSGKKCGRGARERRQGRNQNVLDVRQDRTHCAPWCRKGRNTHLYAMDEDDSENAEESAENEEELQAWCLLEESVQEVISRRSKQRAKEVNEASLLSVQKQSQLESEEDCGGERQVGESQSHHGLWSRRSCDA